MTKTRKQLNLLDDSESDDKKNKSISASLDLSRIRTILDSIEDDVQSLKEILMLSNIRKQGSELHLSKNGKMVEGVFNGESMIDKNSKKYVVPQNYASKSKLIPGDVLKLSIASDGSFIYKQIGPIDRKKIIGTVKESDGKYYVKSEGKKYNILLASVTYFKLKEEDKVTIIVPRDKESNWAAVENVIEKIIN